MIPPKTLATLKNVDFRSPWCGTLTGLRPLIVEDDRFDYGESRYRAMGYIGDRLHVVVFTPRGDAVHVISFRKANKREVKSYDQETQS